MCPWKAGLRSTEPAASIEESEHGFKTKRPKRLRACRGPGQSSERGVEHSTARSADVDSSASPASSVIWYSGYSSATCVGPVQTLQFIP